MEEIMINPLIGKPILANLKKKYTKAVILG